MLDPKNNVVLTGGIVRTPELVGNDKILKFSVAVDFAASEKGGDNTTGYFDVTYFLNDEDHGRNSKFVKSQFDAGNIDKGTQVQLVGRLVQERWTPTNGTGDGKKQSKVAIVAESVTYAGGNRKNEQGERTSPARASAGQGMPDSF